MNRLLLAAGLLAAGLSAQAAPPESPLAPILAVGREGKGNAAAAAAWKDAFARGPAAIGELLAAFDTASPTAANWLRSAVSAIADTERAAGRMLPVGPLKSFVQDVKRKPAARRIAFELYAAENKAEASDLLATLVDDPDADLRRDAIAEGLARAAKAGSKQRLEAQRQLLPLARDRDQIDELAKAVDSAAGPTGSKFDKTAHLGYVTEWLIAGPFDNTKGSGLAKAYDPETVKFDPNSEFAGKSAVVSWMQVQCSDEFGKIDLNKDVGKLQNAVAYARAVVTAAAPTPAEVRVTSPNAMQVFVNERKLYERDVYHNGGSADGHVVPVVLDAGENVILLKVAQNDMTQAWAQSWEFSARVCDATGGRLPLQQLVPDAAGKPQLVPLSRHKPAPAPEKK